MSLPDGLGTMPLANDVSSLDVNIAGAARRALSFDLPRRDKRVPKQSNTVQVTI